MRVVCGYPFTHNHWVVVADWLGRERIVYDPGQRDVHGGWDSLTACLGYVKHNKESDNA